MRWINISDTQPSSGSDPPTHQPYPFLVPVTQPPPGGMVGFSAVLHLRKQCVIMFGGKDIDDEVFFGPHLYVFELRARRWWKMDDKHMLDSQGMSIVCKPRAYHTAAIVGSKSDHMLIYGGETVDLSQKHHPVSDDVLLLDLVTMRWTTDCSAFLRFPSASMNGISSHAGQAQRGIVPRSWHACCVDDRGNCYVVGGGGGGRDTARGGAMATIFRAEQSVGSAGVMFSVINVSDVPGVQHRESFSRIRGHRLVWMKGPGTMLCIGGSWGDGDSKTFMNPGIMSVSPDRSCLSFEALINFKLECEGLACVVVPHAGREVCMIHGGMSRNRTTGANRIRRRMDITSIHPQLLALKVDRKSGLGRQISHTILYNGVDSLVAVTGMTSVNGSLSCAIFTVNKEEAFGDILTEKIPKKIQDAEGTTSDVPPTSSTSTISTLSPKSMNNVSNPAKQRAFKTVFTPQSKTKKLSSVATQITSKKINESNDTHTSTTATSTSSSSSALGKRHPEPLEEHQQKRRRLTRNLQNKQSAPLSPTTQQSQEEPLQVRNALAYMDSIENAQNASPAASSIPSTPDILEEFRKAKKHMESCMYRERLFLQVGLEDRKKEIAELRAQVEQYRKENQELMDTVEELKSLIGNSARRKATPPT